jgi:hypothetical protein
LDDDFESFILAPICAGLHKASGGKVQKTIETVVHECLFISEGRQAFMRSCIPAYIGALNLRITLSSCITVLHVSAVYWDS